MRPCEWQDGLGSVAGAYDALNWDLSLRRMQRWLEEEPSGRVPNLPALGMSNSYHGEPYIPADIFNVSFCHHHSMLAGSPTVGLPQSKVQVGEMVARALLARAHSSHQPAWCGNTMVAEGRTVVTREPHDGHHVTPENSCSCSCWTGSACTLYNLPPDLQLIQNGSVATTVR